MAGWDDVSSVTTDAGSGWDAVSSPVQESPKMPNVTGVQKMAADNLAAFESTGDQQKDFDKIISKPIQSPEERLNTAAGFPVNKVVNGTAQASDLNAANRAHYVGALKDGSASNSSDWMQTMLHAITPTVAGVKSYPAQALDAYIGGVKGAAGLIAYPFVSDASKKELRKGYELSENTGTTASGVNRVLELEQATIGRAMGGLFAPVAAPIAPILSPAIEATELAAKQAGATSEWAQTIPKGIGAAMDIAGLKGMHSMGRALRPEVPAAPWDNHPGADPIKHAVAKKMEISPDAVSSEHIDQIISQGSKDLMPAGDDFKAVATVLDHENIPQQEATLHEIYKETGVHPAQVFEDVRNDPAVRDDVLSGRVPKAYEHLAEPKPEVPAEKLSVEKSDTAKAFNIIDEDGNIVRSGFESAEEARHHIEDQSEGKIPDEPPEWSQKGEPVKDGEQAVIPGAEKITDRALAEREMEKPKRAEVKQKDADEGLFDTGAQKQTDLLDLKPAEAAKPELAPEPKTIEKSQKALSTNTVKPSEIGKPTSLSTFIKNNGGIKMDGHEASWLEKNNKDLLKKNGKTFDEMGELAHEQGYFSERPALNDFADLLDETNGGREHFRSIDGERIIKSQEAAAAREAVDPAFVEHEAHRIGLDTEPLAGETPKQTTKRLLKQLSDFYRNTEGTARVRNEAGQWLLEHPIEKVQEWTGKMTGGFFTKLGEGYVKTFEPELMGDKALRADAYMAKYKTAKQEAENSYYRASAKFKEAWDKTSHEERMQWLYDHETGRWSEHADPDHARYQALLDSTFKAEKESIGADAEKGYKENYLPHAWENPDAVREFFSTDAMIKKYGKDGFTKASTFQLIQDGVRAGFKLKTDNPESMLVARQLAGHDMIATMDLLKDMHESGIAVPAKAFSVDKRIEKINEALEDAKKKYNAASDKINDPAQLKWDFKDPSVSKYMKGIESRVERLNNRLAEAQKEKASYKNVDSAGKLDPELQKNGFKIIGPDSKVWNIHNEAGPLWKNAMASKGLWENQGVIGDAYRTYYSLKSNWVAVKLALSLFHPVHVAMIDLANSISTPIKHLVDGGKITDLLDRQSIPDAGLWQLGKSLVKKDSPGINAWNTAEAMRTPEQQYMVQKRVEGGFKPTMSARDTVHFKDNFNKAINGIGLNNLRLLGTALQLPGTAMKPFMEHWIPSLKDAVYEQRTELALKANPSLVNDAGRRGEVFRQITKDIERTYGEMNQDVLFWNPVIRDSFNAAYISGGWKLAQIYNARGLLQPGKIAGKFAKTGEFSKSDITYNMLQSYTYTALTMATGAAIAFMLGTPIKEAGDDVWDVVKNLVTPQTGEKNPDGTPIRLSQPAFAKEAYMLARDINTEGIISGTGDFVYHTTLIPGIMNVLNNQDFTGRELISDPTDLNQWLHSGWDSISPITIGGYEKADAKNSEVAKMANLLGFPIAGAYMNQTPFEQKVLHTYSKQNPPKGDVYQGKLKGDLREAVKDGDLKAVEEIRAEMKKQGMTDKQIQYAAKPYTKKFVDTAWEKLPESDKKKLIESASDEEKKKFKVK